MDAKKNNNAKPRFVVVAIRHFENGEHRWFAPEGVEEADACSTHGTVRENRYHKPTFTSMFDAKVWAFLMTHEQCTLAQWEYRRPTFIVVEEDAYVAVVEKYEYAYPPEADGWCAEQLANYERKDDCDDFLNECLWDSDTDEDRYERCEELVETIREIDAMDGLASHVSHSGYIAVELLDKKAMDGLPVEIVIEVRLRSAGFDMNRIALAGVDRTASAAFYELR